MTRGGWHAEARKLKAKGLTYSEIARRVGVTPSAVTKALNPEAARAYNAKQDAKPGRYEEKQRAARASSMKPEYRGRCATCGGPMGIGVRDDGECAACRSERRHERAERIVGWWAEGLLMREIAERLDWSIVQLSVEMARLRDAGYDLPHRYVMQDGRRIAA